uniref:Gag-Pol polyprotein n=1 Tax=Tanacetum cinerariifolium TaxID=118510 RepID=A0A6L2KG59_TANCI|nr:hypothetical protein [Tanacetum cinerariifolium]
MFTQQDIYAAGSENRPPMLNKDNYVPWSSHIIRYERSRPNGKMIVDSIENGPYVRRMIATLGEPDLPVLERVRQMMKGSDIGEQENKAKLFNEWEKFTSTDGESIESYYHRFMQLMNDLKRNKHFLENIASNLKFLNNLQPEWKIHVIINQQGYNAWHNSEIQGAQNTVQNAGVQGGANQNGLVVVPGIANQNGTGNVVAARAEGTGNGNQARCYNYRGLGYIARNCTTRPRRRDVAYLQTQLLIAQKEEAGIQHQAEEFEFMAAADGSAGVQLNDNCYDNKIFNMFTQEEQYTDLLEPIHEPQLVPQNDNHVTFVAPSMVQSGGIIETSFAPNEETRAHQETVYHNLVDQAAQVNMINCNIRATNVELKSELARYKI